MNQDLILTIITIIWISIGSFCAMKWEKCNPSMGGIAWVLCLLAAPIAFIISLIRQYIIEDWK